MSCRMPSERTSSSNPVEVRFLVAGSRPVNPDTARGKALEGVAPEGVEGRVAVRRGDARGGRSRAGRIVRSGRPDCGVVGRWKWLWREHLGAPPNAGTGAT